jgi:hypothetical protein
MAEKLAFPKMFRGADGRQKLGYFDEEGNLIEDLRGYRVVTGGGTDYYDPTPDGTDTDPDEQDLNPDPAVRAAHRETVSGSDGGQKSRQESAGYAYATSQAAKSYAGVNRGYINKPGWMKYTSLLPGAAGTIAKAVNLGINANNVAAVNSARKAMGLDPVGIGGAIKGTLKDNQGQIAMVEIGSGQYPIGFEALDKYGRTNMTPEEAMARARALGVDIKEIEFSKPAKEDNNKGLLGKAKEAIFGPEDGDVKVTPDAEIAEREWADVPEPTEDAKGNVTVTDPNNTARTSVFGPLDQTQFDRNIQEWSQYQRDLKVADFNEVENTKKANIAAFPPGTAAPKPDIKNLDIARAAYETQKAYDKAVAAPDVAGLGISRNAFDTSYGVNRAAINAGITAMDMDAPGGVTNPAKTISAQMAALPDISRNAFDTQKAVSSGMKMDVPDPARFGSSVKSTVNPITGMNMVGMDAPDPSRFGGIASDLSPTAHQSVFSGTKPTDSVAKGMLASKVTNNAAPTGRFANVDISTASPAQMAALGLVNRTQQEREAMARTIAGELSPSSLKALAANDPNAQREVANMVASMENRVAKVGSMAEVLSPSQYNSNMASNMNTTLGNYGIYGPAIDAAIAGYYTGQIAPSNYGITHYYNPDISNPSWGAAMQDTALVGEHLFGGIPGDFKPGADFNAMRESYAKAQISDTRGFMPSTAQLARTSPTDTSYTPGIGKGATSSPGNSVSGASRSTAGKTFGSAGSRADSGIGRNDGAGAGRGSSMGGPSIGGGSSKSSGGGNYGGGNSGPGGSAGKSASGGVSGASRSTAGKGGASPSAKSGGLSGASRSTAGKTSGSSSSGKSNPSTSGNMGSGAGTTSGKGPGIGSA